VHTRAAVLVQPHLISARHSLCADAAQHRQCVVDTQLLAQALDQGLCVLQGRCGPC
jgi:hypothetical protein